MDRHQDQVRFSVVIPAYNEADYLSETLQSLRDQDFDGPYEVIVVDNHSTDETASVAATFGVRWCTRRARGLRRTTTRVGGCRGRDHRVHRCRHRATPELVAQPRRTFAAASDAGGRRGGTLPVPEPLLVGPGVPDAGVRPRSPGCSPSPATVCYVTATNLAVRRSAFPGYDVKLTQGGDELDLLRRLRRVGRVIWNRHNVVTTSPRRLQQRPPLQHRLSFFVYYLLAYLLNRMCGRRLSARHRLSATRTVSPSRRRPRRRGALGQGPDRRSWSPARSRWSVLPASARRPSPPGRRFWSP